MNKLPNSWNKKRLKHFSNYFLSSVDRHTYGSEIGVSVCHYPNVYHNEKILKSTDLPRGTCTNQELEKFRVIQGDVLITKDSESPEDIGVPSYVEDKLEHTVCGYHLGIIRCEDLVNPNFIFRFLQSDVVKSYFFCESSGITRFGLGKPSVENLEVPLPPLQEQKRISQYLDKKTQHIDNLIEKIQKKIALLKEQRTALINQCVTKGLDLNVEMKDSGVEWIGEIPRHWELKKLKHLVSYNEETLGENTKLDYEFHYIEIGDVDYIDGIKINEKIRFGESPSRARRVVQSKDVIISTVRTYLRAIGVIPELEDVVCSTGFCVLRGNPEELDQEFLSYSVRSEWFISEVIGNSYGVSYPAINSSELVEIKVAVPPLTEQKKISQKLFTEIGKKDILIGVENKRINLYQEYRQSLISSVVTGKVRITEDML